MPIAIATSRTSNLQITAVISELMATTGCLELSAKFELRNLLKIHFNRMNRFIKMFLKLLYSLLKRFAFHETNMMENWCDFFQNMLLTENYIDKHQWLHICDFTRSFKPILSLSFFMKYFFFLQPKGKLTLDAHRGPISPLRKISRRVSGNWERSCPETGVWDQNPWNRSKSQS